MSRWVDVRVPAGEGATAFSALLTALQPLTCRFDTQPLASGPEVEISVQSHTEIVVLGVLQRSGITVLASRTRIAQAMEVPE